MWNYNILIVVVKKNFRSLARPLIYIFEIFLCLTAIIRRYGYYGPRSNCAKMFHQLLIHCVSSLTELFKTFFYSCRLYNVIKLLLLAFICCAGESFSAEFIERFENLATSRRPIGPLVAFLFCILSYICDVHLLCFF